MGTPTTSRSWFRYFGFRIRLMYSCLSRVPIQTPLAEYPFEIPVHPPHVRLDLPRLGLVDVVEFRRMLRVEVRCRRLIPCLDMGRILIEAEAPRIRHGDHQLPLRLHHPTHLVHDVVDQPWLQMFHDVGEDDAVKDAIRKRPRDSLGIVDHIHACDLAPVHADAARLLVLAASHVEPHLPVLVSQFTRIGFHTYSYHPGSCSMQ